MLHAMIAIQDKLISEDVLKSHFACELAACKGACCWEGDFGAPLKEEELDILDGITERLEPYIERPYQDLIRESKGYEWNEETQCHVTRLREDAACVYMTTDSDGVAQCGIEKAWKDGAISFQKPISCHLYPIRVSEKPEHGFTALNYDRWSICNPACKAGKQQGMRLFRFLKEALIRRFGAAFYDELEAVAETLYPEKK